MSGIQVPRRRCQGCTRPIVMSGGHRQSGVYYNDGAGRRALCWGCYDVARGNEWSADARASLKRRGLV